MEININSASIEAGIAELGELDKTTQEVIRNAHQATLNGSYSGVSGLDQLGSGHGTVLNGGPGSAMSVLESYAEQINWLHQALIASSAALTGQNTFVSRGMDIADEGGSVGADAVSFPQRPMPRFENFSFTPPVVAPALTIDQLATDFSTTNIGASIAAAKAWQTMSSGIAAVASGLSGVAGTLAADNSGEVIDAAVQKISEVARAGDTFSRNSGIMATSVQQLANIKSHGNVQVNLARTALAAIPDPVQRKAAEQSFLMSFPAAFSPSVATGVPPIRNLMSIDGSADGGGEVALGMSDVEGDGPAAVEGLNPAGATSGAVNVMRQAMTTGQFGSIDRGLGELGTVGATPAEFDDLLAAESVGTSAASLATPGTSIPALSGIGTTAGTGAPGVAGVAGNPGGLAGPGMPPGVVGGSRLGAGGRTGAPTLPGPQGIRGVPGSLGTVGGATGVSPSLGGGRGPGVLPAGGGVAGAPPLPGLSAASGVPGSAGPVPMGGMGTPMMGAMGGGASGASAGNPARGISGISGGGGIGGVGGGHPAVGGSGARGGAGSGTGISGGAGPRGSALPGAPGATGAGSSVSGENGNPRAGGTGARGAGAGGGPARGMMPMMGAPMAGAGGGQGKAAKVKTVTSAVEEDGNIAALLGERGPVVPGVIGAWARG